MTTLLIKTKSAIHKSRQSIHALAIIDLNLNPEDVIDTGFLTKGREVWLNSTSPCTRTRA